MGHFARYLPFGAVSRGLRFLRAGFSDEYRGDTAAGGWMSGRQREVAGALGAR